MADHRVTPGSRRATGFRTRAKAAAAAVGIAGLALTGAATLGMTPTLSASPQLLSTLHYLRGTNIAFVPSQEQFEDFISAVIDGTGVPAPDEPYQIVPYNAGFKPFSHGFIKDLTFDDSVAQGVSLLDGQNPAPGDIIFGFSQGAVAASIYKGTHTGNTYILTGNASRPNGGVMERFKGIHVPFLDVTFSGATPNNGDPTIDIALQYDGYADFPTYLGNPVALANAFAGVLFVHGNTQLTLTAADLEAAKNSGDSDYYQVDAATNTTYYVIKTYPVPLLFPVKNILPPKVLAALDAPLRKIIESAYDRGDYGTPTPARLFPPRPPRAGQVPAGATTASTESESASAVAEGVATVPSPQGAEPAVASAPAPVGSADSAPTAPRASGENGGEARPVKKFFDRVRARSARQHDSDGNGVDSRTADDTTNSDGTRHRQRSGERHGSSRPGSDSPAADTSSVARAGTAADAAAA